MTKEEFTKMKQELEAYVTFTYTPGKMLHSVLVLCCFMSRYLHILCFSEYLAIFKKTVAMHEVFLCRVAAHPSLRKDLNFHVFLEYNQDVSVCVFEVCTMFPGLLFSGPSAQLIVNYCKQKSSAFH